MNNMNREYLDFEDAFDEIDEGTNITDEIKEESFTNSDKEVKEEDDVKISRDMEDMIIHIDDFVFDIDSDNYDDYYDLCGARETENRLKHNLRLGQESYALALAKEYAEKMEMEKNRKKERERLYKTDKKCYNINENDKNCKKDKTEDRIYTRINIRKIKKLLRYEGITYEEVAKATGTSKRSITRKLNVYTDLTANELVIICDLLNINISEVIYKNEH